MNASSTNRRIKYTKTVLKNSFIQLLSKNDISKITVKKICEVADINRTTFYLHFKDPYDLFAQIENEFINNITADLSNCDFKHPNEYPIIKIVRTLDYIKDNYNIAKILFANSNNTTFTNHIISLIGKKYFYYFNDNPLFEEQDEYTFIFFATGTLAIIKKWINEGMTIPSEHIAKLIINLAISEFSG